jgi:DeoR family suf operon transcriptional repressor
VASTREQVLRIVRGQKEVTVAQVAEAVGLSQQAVRRHLDTLRADALVDVRLARHGVGRPALVFFATERSEEHSGRTYLQLMSRLMRHLEKVDSVELSGATGHQVLDRVFAGIAEEVAADHVSEVRGHTLDQRVAQVSRALEGEGIVDSWTRVADGAYQIVNGECPYLRLAAMSDAPCRADQHSIELLVGAPVTQTKRIVDGSPVCEYIVRPEPVTLLEGSA